MCVLFNKLLICRLFLGSHLKINYSKKITSRSYKACLPQIAKISNPLRSVMKNTATVRNFDFVLDEFKVGFITTFT